MSTSRSWRDRLRDLPAPQPAPELLARILASRAAGTRVVLPLAHRRPTRLLWLSALAAVLAAVLVSSRGSEPSGGEPPRDPLAEVLRGTLVWPAPGEAQESQAATYVPRYALVRAADLAVQRVREGVWTYESFNITDDVLRQRGGDYRLVLRRGRHGGAEVWTAHTQRHGEQGHGWGPIADTAYIDPATLRPIEHRMVGYKGRTIVVQKFSADSGHETIDVSGPRPRSLRGTIALPFRADAPFVTGWYGLRILAPALPLARGWRASIYEVGWLSLPQQRMILVPYNVRVAGRERITVPAGRFECWRLELQHPLDDGARFRVWIARDEGWVVKTERRGSDWRREELLVSYVPAP